MESSTAAPESTGSRTIADMMGLAAERYGDRTAADVQARRRVGRGLLPRARRDRLGDRPRADRPRASRPATAPRCCARTRPEWTYASFGITSAGGVVVPIYPTNSPEECEWVAGNSESRFVIAEDASQVAKIAAGARPAAAARGGHRDRPERRRRRRDPARRPARARPRPRRRRGGRARRRGLARGPVHLHLHLRHHRAAEGLRARPRQLPHRRHDVRDAPRSCTRATSSTSTCRSPTRSRC